MPSTTVGFSHLLPQASVIVALGHSEAVLTLCVVCVLTVHTRPSLFRSGSADQTVACLIMSFFIVTFTATNTLQCIIKSILHHTAY